MIRVLGITQVENTDTSALSASHHNGENSIHDGFARADMETKMKSLILV